MTKKKIILVTGSGLDVHYGIPTFRDEDNELRKYRLDKDEILAKIKDITISPAYEAINRLNEEFEVIIFTTNVTGLHRRFNPDCTVFEVHGNIFEDNVLKEGDPYCVDVEKYIRHIFKRDDICNVYYIGSNPSTGFFTWVLSHAMFEEIPVACFNKNYVILSQSQPPKSSYMGIMIKCFTSNY